MTSSDDAIAYGSPTGRWVLAATILGSGIAALDATVVNVALPRIGDNLDAGLPSLQWMLNAYTLTLAGLLLIGGSLGDRYGRRRVFLIGVVWFAVASAGCALAPNAAALIAMRALQGVGGALLTPGSLAILEASFAPADRAAAVGAWPGLGGVATALGPVLGGVLVGSSPSGWRLVFLINVPLAAFVVFVTVRHVPESRDPAAHGRIDVAGAVLAAAALAGIVYGLTAGPEQGWGPGAVGSLAIGVLALLVFGVVEHRSPNPMLPLSLFSSTLFSAANGVTFVVYAALGGTFFLLPLQLQRGAGFSPLAAGSALLPITAVMLVLSARMGRLAQRIGPRVPMTIGPLLQAAGLLLLRRIGVHAGYLSDVLPGLLVLALGLAFTVAPLTATVLAAAPAAQVGIASAVNNDVARTAGLLAVAVLPGAIGLTQQDYGQPSSLSSAFGTGLLVLAGLCAAGGVLAFVSIRRPVRPAEVATGQLHCAVTGPPPAAPHTLDPLRAPPAR